LSIQAVVVRRVYEGTDRAPRWGGGPAAGNLRITNGRYVETEVMKFLMMIKRKENQAALQRPQSLRPWEGM
jgi:hypothetical protein